MNINDIIDFYYLYYLDGNGNDIIIPNKTFLHKLVKMVYGDHFNDLGIKKSKRDFIVPNDILLFIIGELQSTLIFLNIKILADDEYITFKLKKSTQLWYYMEALEEIPDISLYKLQDNDSIELDWIYLLDNIVCFWNNKDANILMLEDLCDHIHDLNNIGNNKQQTIDSLKKELSDTIDELNEIPNELLELKTANRKLTANVQELNSAIDALNIENVQLEYNATQLSDEIETLCYNNLNLKSTIDSLSCNISGIAESLRKLCIKHSILIKPTNLYNYDLDSPQYLNIEIREMISSIDYVLNIDTSNLQTKLVNLKTDLQQMEQEYNDFSQKYDDKKKPFECKICFVNLKTVALVPCGHCVCADCSNKIIGEDCPYCRSQVRDKMTIYL